MARRRPAQSPREDVEWHFFSFPVAYGFAWGALIAFIIALSGFGYFVWVVALFGVSFGTAHIITHWFRRRTLDKRLQRADEDERERRALAARQANAIQGEQASAAQRRRRRGRR